MNIQICFSLDLIDHFHNKVSSFEIFPGTSFAWILCGSKSQKHALHEATHEIVLYAYLQNNRYSVDFLLDRESHLCLKLNLTVKQVYLNELLPMPLGL